jgi:hypothetical protein
MANFFFKFIFFQKGFHQPPSFFFVHFGEISPQKRNADLDSTFIWVAVFKLFRQV